MAKDVIVGIVGAGRIGIVHAKSIAYEIPGVTIKTVADPYLTDEAAALLTKLGVENVTKDYKEIINDPDIEAVFICSSTATHSPISQEACKAGKHVFCEKPVDLDIDKIKATLKVVRDSGVKYQVGFNRRFDHNFMALKAAIDSGKIGDVHVLKLTSRDPGPPPIEYIKVSGGIFYDMLVHDFDVARFLSGSEVVEVYAAAAVRVDEEIGKAGDYDTAVVTLKFENGAIAVVDGSRKASYGYDQRVEVFGSKGAVAIGNDALSTAVISNETGVTSEKPLHFFLERYMGAYSEEKVQFFDAIRNNKKPPVGGYDGLVSVVIAEAAKRSAQENRPVKISEITDLND
ncbi:MAG: inositol 2-dehydrogenase [Spirochaetales bacterium]|nr:inositol 2-dehydrogenase [Spirochaetales bacterium]